VIIGPFTNSQKNLNAMTRFIAWPAQLAKRGIKIAFASYDSHQARNLPYAPATPLDLDCRLRKLSKP